MTGGRPPSFRGLSLGEALASRFEEAGRTVEGASFPRRQVTEKTRQGASKLKKSFCPLSISPTKQPFRSSLEQ